MFALNIDGLGFGFSFVWGDGSQKGFGDHRGGGRGRSLIAESRNDKYKVSGRGAGITHGFGDGPPESLYLLYPYMWLTDDGRTKDTTFDNYAFHLQVEPLVHRRV